jgi:hypothetical protein
MAGNDELCALHDAALGSVVGVSVEVEFGRQQYWTMETKCSPLKLRDRS